MSNNNNNNNDIKLEYNIYIKTYLSENGLICDSSYLAAPKMSMGQSYCITSYANAMKRYILPVS